MTSTDNTPDRDPQSYLTGDHNPQRVMDAAKRYVARMAAERAARTADDES